MTTQFTVDAEHARHRLDVFLSEIVEDLTRSQAKKRIEAGEVLVNGKTAAVHRFLNEGDVVDMGQGSRVGGQGGGMEDEGGEDESKRSNARRTTHHAPLRILAETSSWLVAYKPAGVLMHPTSKGETDTFIDAVIAHAPEVAKVGEDPAEPGIVSRLDRDVSGLVVIAKTQSAYDDLKRQFKTRKVEKTYLALVYGDVPQDEGDLKFRIARSESKARMAALPKESSQGRAAWTHYAIVQRLNGAALLKLNILTGRSHQIRAHLFAFNHPVIGDPLYQPRSSKRNIIPSRLMLESVALEFNDPESEERKRFEIKPDAAFEELIAKLK
jgi:23S rRNA pseudouridine1911/1915/1917 synthase